MDATLLFAYAESPLHHGGSESLGVIDLPIQRESTTGIPTIWGQSAKGALRQHATSDPRWKPDQVTAVFGSEVPGDGGTEGQLSAGWLAVGDFRLVALPVPTLEHTFAWATSPLLLSRLARVAGLAGITGLPPVPMVGTGAVLAKGDQWAITGNCPGLVIADYVLNAVHDGHASEWGTWLADNGLPGLPEGDEQQDVFTYFRNKLRTDLLIVGDDDMVILAKECTEIVARVQLSASKTVSNGPWYTEYLPTETLLVSFMRRCSPKGNMPELKALLDRELLVAGGNETVGKGLMWLRWLDGVNA